MEDQLYKEDMDDHNELMDYLGQKLLKKVKLESPGGQSSKDRYTCTNVVYENIFSSKPFNYTYCTHDYFRTLKIFGIFAH